MRRGGFLVLALTGALACTLSLWADEDREQAKHHHELRGKIVKVELEKNEFTINGAFALKLAVAPMRSLRFSV